MLESAIGFEHLVSETVTTTPTHPFYVPQKGWTEAVHLRAGDILVTCNGEYVVVELVQHELLEAPITVYNFEVEDFHTYYVAANEDAEFVLVHNTCKKDAELYGTPGEIKKGPQEYKRTHIGPDGRANAQLHLTDHSTPNLHTNPHWHTITWRPNGTPKFLRDISGMWPYSKD